MQQFFDEAQAGSRWSNCAKQKVGVVLVKDGSIVSVGWNSCACGGCSRCAMIPSEKCARLDLPSGEGYELSRPVHAEVSAMLRVRLDRSLDDFERCIATVEPTEELYAGGTGSA